MMPNTNYNLFNGTSETLALAGGINNLEKAKSTRPKISEEAPSIEEIRYFKKLEFRIEEKGNKALEEAVQNEINNLKEKYPDWDFNAVYGN